MSLSAQKTRNLLGICIKAGKTVKGFDSVCESVRSGKAKCVLTAADASEKTVKETAFICGKYGVPHLSTELTKEDIGRLCGKNTAVIASQDEGFAKAFVKMAENE